MKRGPSTVRRGAGTIRRGAGNRRGNELGSRTRGHESSMSSSRRASARLSDDDDDEEEAQSRTSEDDRERKDARSGTEPEEDLEEEEPDYGVRTLGKACIYGARGEVVYRPRDGWCRGDVAPPPAAVAPSPARHRKPPTASRNVERRRRELPASSRNTDRHHRPLPRKAVAPTRRPTRDQCTYDSDGRLTHTPAGGFCPPRATKRGSKTRR